MLLGRRFVFSSCSLLVPSPAHQINSDDDWTTLCFATSLSCVKPTCPLRSFKSSLFLSSLQRLPRLPSPDKIRAISHWHCAAEMTVDRHRDTRTRNMSARAASSINLGPHFTLDFCADPTTFGFHLSRQTHAATSVWPQSHSLSDHWPIPPLLLGVNTLQGFAHNITTSGPL